MYIYIYTIHFCHYTPLQHCYVYIYNTFLSEYLNDGVVDVHVVLLANGCRWQLAQQHLHWYEKLQDAHLLSAGILVAVVAGICQCLCCCGLHTRQTALTYSLDEGGPLQFCSECRP